jgi:hypothetical protein
MVTGLCACGCGQPTRVPTRTVPLASQIAGIPLAYVHGHNSRGQGNPAWKGGRHALVSGYIVVWVPGHPRATRDGYVLEHLVVAERALGKSLPDQAQVHHVNEAKWDNAPRHLVICEDAAYHQLLHRRAEAWRACGHADWRKCPFCQHWDEPRRMYVRGRQNYHRACKHAYEQRHQG